MWNFLKSLFTKTNAPVAPVQAPAVEVTSEVPVSAVVETTVEPKIKKPRKPRKPAVITATTAK